MGRTSRGNHVYSYQALVDKNSRKNVRTEEFYRSSYARDGTFTMNEKGDAVRNSDGGIFRASAMKHERLKYVESGSTSP